LVFLLAFVTIILAMVIGGDINDGLWLTTGCNFNGIVSARKADAG